jgi:glycosyltransferase involved in cell wall biosynthesis
MPKVSVVIPAYNAMAFLPETLKSVFRQTYQDFEVILVDDGSIDQINPWIQTITDSRVKYITQPNQGPAVARNNGIANARGMYIAFLDADDLWHPEKLAKQVKILDKSSEIGLVYSWVGSVDERGNITNKIRKNYAEGNVWEKIIEHNIAECGSNPMVRRVCFEKVGKFEPEIAYAQDWQMWLKIASTFQFKVIKETLVYYRDHSRNRSKQIHLMEESFQAIVEEIFDSVPSNLQKFKNRCYSFVYLHLAWKTLQNMNGEHYKSLEFRRKAINYYPKIILSREFIRLSLATILVRLFGIQSYSKFRNFFYSLK